MKKKLNDTYVRIVPIYREGARRRQTFYEKYMNENKTKITINKS